MCCSWIAANGSCAADLRKVETAESGKLIDRSEPASEPQRKCERGEEEGEDGNGAGIKIGFV